MKPILLDTFCKAGGAGMGYSRAGFDVYGIDIEPQPRYPFPFLQMDAIEALDRLIAGEGLTFCNGVTLTLDDISALHGSPPCQDYSRAMRGLVKQSYPRLIDPTRTRFLQTGKPYVIENVMGAELPSAFILCGMTFRLSMHRHRMFETHPFWMLAPTCQHPKDQTRNGYAMSPYNSVNREAWGVGKGKGGAQRLMGTLMEIDWMMTKEISEAIPPAYTNFIGTKLLSHLGATP